MVNSIIKEITISGLVALFLFLFFSVGIKSVMGTDVPLAVVESGSMKPTLNVGDIIIVRGINPSELKVGDIIVYQRANSDIMIVHRIIQIIQSGDSLLIRTKGDNNPAPDPWYITAKEVKGLVILKIPYLGYIPLTFQKFPQLYVALFLLIVIFMLLPSRKK